METKQTVIDNDDIKFAIKAGMVTDAEVKLFLRMFKIAHELRHNKSLTGEKA